MTWVKLDDGFPDHPKMVAVGPLACWLHVCVLSYCNRHLTDGHIPSGMVTRLADLESPKDLVEKLLKHGVWELAEDGFQVHDYLDYQPSKEKIEGERAEARARMKKVREKKKPVRPNKTRSSPEVRVTPTRPDPTPPVPSKEAKGVIWSFLVARMGEPLQSQRSGYGKVAKEFVERLQLDGIPESHWGEELTRRHLALSETWGEEGSTPRSLLKYWKDAGKAADGTLIRAKPKSKNGEVSPDELMAYARQQREIELRQEEQRDALGS